MIEGYTIGSAYASFDEARKGRLAAGQLADVVILTRDIFERPPTSADDVQVATTIFDGKIVYPKPIVN